MKAARRLALLALMGGAVMAGPIAGPVAAGAQEWGDAGKGLQFARKACAECHAVLKRQALSPAPNAPTFKEIANTPGMTWTALVVWFRSVHPTVPKRMPNFILSDDDMDNVIAYILSLRDKKRSE
jgi:mono/diheme cytochrome c family protein